MKKIIIIGGGIAGMEAARCLNEMGFETVLIEKETTLGGHVAKWHHLFPTLQPAEEIVRLLRAATRDSSVILGKQVEALTREGNFFKAQLSDGRIIPGNAVLMTTGFSLFNAQRKEEYGYGIYNNVITSADLETLLHSGQPLLTPSGKVPDKVAFIHCVGSRDDKVGNRYCSRVCCVTAVKQAIEIREKIPACQPYCFYMDLRMFGLEYEQLYLDAQAKYGVTFIRGRLSEAAEDIEGNLVIKAEDTLMGRPLKMTVDLLVLMVGMEANRHDELFKSMPLLTGKERFIQPLNGFSMNNYTEQEGLFVAGTCSGPKNIPETLADVRSGCLAIREYLNK
ncbi:MAG: FAD-dependent oxidoreductase [Bacteroidales bacterium]